MTYDEEDKHLRQFQDGALNMELLIPFRPGAQPTEYFSIAIRHGSLKVFEIRWDKTGYFKVCVFKSGDWERTLHVARSPEPPTVGSGCSKSGNEQTRRSTAF